MTEITTTPEYAAEYRKDGSQVATEHDPSGETATERTQRLESLLPNNGVNPEYEDDDEPTGRSKPARSVADAFGIDDKNLYHPQTENQELRQAVRGLD